MRTWIFIVTFVISAVISTSAHAEWFTANFRSEIGPLPKTAKQKLNNDPDFKFQARSWDEAIHTGQTWVGSERQTSTGASVFITGVEIREMQGRGRNCVLGDMVVNGLQPCPKPAWKGSPILKSQTGQKKERTPAAKTH